jgi:hypothetical protein
MSTKLTDTSDNPLRSMDQIRDDIDHWSAHLDSLHHLDPAEKHVRQVLDGLRWEYTEAILERAYQYQLPGPSLDKNTSASRQDWDAAKKVSSESQPQLRQPGESTVDASPRTFHKLSKPPHYSSIKKEKTGIMKTLETKENVRREVKVDNENVAAVHYADHEYTTSNDKPLSTICTNDKHMRQQNKGTKWSTTKVKTVGDVLSFAPNTLSHLGINAAAAVSLSDDEDLPTYDNEGYHDADDTTESFGSANYTAMTTWGDPVWGFDSIKRAPQNSDIHSVASDTLDGYSCGGDLEDSIINDFGDADDVIYSSRPAVSTPTEEDSGDECNVISRPSAQPGSVDAVEDHNMSGQEHVSPSNHDTQFSPIHGGLRATAPNWDWIEEYSHNLATFGQIQAHMHEQTWKRQIEPSRLDPTSVDMTPGLPYASTGTQIPPWGDPGMHEDNTSYISSLNGIGTPKTGEKEFAAVKFKDELVPSTSGDEDSESRQNVDKAFSTPAKSSPDGTVASLRKAFRTLGLAEYTSVDCAQLHSSLHSMLSLPWVRNNHQLTLQVLDAFSTIDKYQDEHGCWELCCDHQEPNPMENQMDDVKQLDTEADNDSDHDDDNDNGTLPTPEALTTSYPTRLPSHTFRNDNMVKNPWALHDFFNLPRGPLAPNAIPTELPAHIEAEIAAILEENDWRLAVLSGKQLPQGASPEKATSRQNKDDGAEEDCRDTASIKYDHWKFSVPGGGNDEGAPSEVESLMSEVNLNVEKDVPQPKASVSKTYTVTYWATIEAEGDTVRIPIDSKDVTGTEKSIIESDASMKKVWKWVQEKGLGDRVGLQEAFDLAKEMRCNDKIVEKKEFVAPAYCHSNRGRSRRSSPASSRSSQTTTDRRCSW